MWFILRFVLFTISIIDLMVWFSRRKQYKQLNFESKSRFVGNVVADILIIVLYTF